MCFALVKFSLDLFNLIIWKTEVKVFSGDSLLLFFDLEGAALLNFDSDHLVYSSVEVLLQINVAFEHAWVNLRVVLLLDDILLCRWLTVINRWLHRQFLTSRFLVLLLSKQVLQVTKHDGEVGQPIHRLYVIIWEDNNALIL